MTFFSILELIWQVILCHQIVCRGFSGKKSGDLSIGVEFGRTGRGLAKYRLESFLLLT